MSKSLQSDLLHHNFDLIFQLLCEEGTDSSPCEEDTEQILSLDPSGQPPPVSAAGFPTRSYSAEIQTPLFWMCDSSSQPHLWELSYTHTLTYETNSYLKPPCPLNS